MKFVYGAIASAALAGAALTGIEPVVQPFAEESARLSIQSVARGAYVQQILTGEPWAEALAGVAGDLAVGQETISLEGTTLRWSWWDFCFEVEVPAPVAEVLDVRECR
jgi:hypothetical protein